MGGVREKVVCQVDPEGRDKLQAPRLLCYICIFNYIFK